MVLFFYKFLSFSSLSEKVLWANIGFTERHMDITEGVTKPRVEMILGARGSSRRGSG
jgi:hypothetical protein